MADRFREQLQSGSFQIVARLPQPKGMDLSSTLSLAASWKDKVGAILVPDNPRGTMGISPLILAQNLKSVGHEVILTISCRDSNRIALGSAALGASAAGIKTILCVSGDYPHSGDHPEAKPVYDLDSVQLVRMLRAMENGNDIAGNPLNEPVSFFLGAALSVTADPIAPQLMKVKKKVNAGVEFFITLPVFTMDQLNRFLDAATEFRSKMLVGVYLPSFQEIAQYREGSIPGTFIPQELVNRWKDDGEESFKSLSTAHLRQLISELRNSAKVAGVCISASGREPEIQEIL